ncbi:MAG: helix-turn-helix transcriptional regulator [Betaproteobacteria bacterium]|nr:helix-turn-helix transcriptional regulator [Betaproteobacteria bacterium]
MIIKQPEILSRADFDEAVVKLRLNVSDVAKETSIPRTYLSEFRNGDRTLRPEHLAKLRDYFESKGIEFDDDAADNSPGDDEVASPHPRLAVGTVCYFPIRGDLTPERVRDVLAEIERNDVRAAELSARKVARVKDLWGEAKGFAKETEDEVSELFALFAANYVLVRYLTGLNNPLAATVEKESLHEIMLDALRESVTRAGIEPNAVPTPESEEEPA